MIGDIGLKVVGIIFKQVVIDITLMVVVIHTIVFGGIAMTRNPIGYNYLVDYQSLADYISLIKQKIAIEVIIVFITEEVATWDKGFELIMPLVYGQLGYQCHQYNLT